MNLNPSQTQTQSQEGLQTASSGSGAGGLQSSPGGGGGGAAGAATGADGGAGSGSQSPRVGGVSGPGGSGFVTAPVTAPVSVMMTPRGGVGPGGDDAQKVGELRVDIARLEAEMRAIKVGLYKLRTRLQLTHSFERRALSNS